MPGNLEALGMNLTKQRFYIAPTGQFEAIVRLPGLQRMASSINWARGLLLLRSSKGDLCPTAATAGPVDPRIPQEYADYANLFNKKTADALPAHQE